MATEKPLSKFSERLGLVFIIQSSSLSILSVSVLLCYAIYHSLRKIFRPNATRGISFLRNSLDYFFLSLLFWDLILALGAAMNILWVHEAKITIGSYCTAQAVFKHIGAVGVAFFTMAIAIYTFLVIFMRWKLPTSRWLPLTVIGLISLFLLLLPVVGTRIHTDPSFYGISTYWCWIRREHYSERIGLEYGLAWFTALLNIFLYVPLFFVLRGNIQVDLEQTESSSRVRRKFSWRWIRKDDRQDRARDERQESMVIAKQMLAYPIAYVILILPMSLVRWIETPTKPLPPVYTALAGIVYSSSGWVNVLLYILTRPSLLPSWRPCRRRTGESGRRLQDASSTESNLEEARTPEMTTVNPTPAAGGNTNQRSAAPPRIRAVAPPATGAPMLTDDETDDEGVSPPRSGVASPRIPSANFSTLYTQTNTLALPATAYRKSRGSSDGSKYDSYSGEASGSSSPGLKY